MTKLFQNIERKKVEKLKEVIKSDGIHINARRKIYNMMIQSLDEQAKSQLTRIEKVIGRYSNELLVNGGWFVSKTGISTQETKPIDSKYAEYLILRDFEGFHLQDNVPATTHQQAVRSIEENLLIDRKLELQILHMAMLMKDDILFNRKYTVTPGKEKEVEDIREILGYNNPANAILPPSDPKIVDLQEVRGKQI